MKAYVEFEILEGAYEISCPDAQCSFQGIMDIEQDIATLASHDLLEKHKRFRLNRGIFLSQIESIAKNFFSFVRAFVFLFLVFFFFFEIYRNRIG